MKKLLLILLSQILLISSVWASLKDDLLWNSESNISNLADGDNGFDVLASLFAWFKDELTSVVAILAVWVFIFIGFRIIMARGNPEEFKKSFIQLLYAVLWVFLVYMAWGLVSLVSNLSL